MTVREHTVHRRHVEAVQISALRLLDGHLGFLIDAIIAAEPGDISNAEVPLQVLLPPATEIVELAAALRQKALAYRTRLEFRDIERQLVLHDTYEWPF